MPLIDGIGDEVVQFGITVIVIAVAVLAWLSTNARPDRYRTVLLMRARGHNPVTVSIRTREGTRIPRTRSSIGQTTAVDVPGVFSIKNSPRPPTIDSSNNRVIPLQEMDSIVDADMAMMNNNRLHFYRRVEGPANIQSVEDTASTGDSSESQEEHDTEPASNAQIREMDSIVSAMEAELDTDHTTIARTTDEASSLSEGNNNNTIPPNENNEDKTEIAAQTEDNLNDDHPNTTDSTEPDGSNQRKILIKLKYINDTLKEVEGSLDEQLKDFKCRHFSAELSSERRVRLIFNGRVLGDEAATLRACGLHHRAVVHCLVQPRRTNANQPHNSAQPQNNVERPGTMHELVTEMINPERYWDLENILMTLVSLALTVVWFFRCEYSNMFTASASVALFGLTVFYSVAIFGLYLSDTFHFERRPAAQPVPTN